MPFYLIRFIWISHTRAEQIFLRWRLCRPLSSICPGMQNQLSPSPYNKRYTNRTGAFPAHSWIYPSQVRKPFFGWICPVGALSRRVHQDPVCAHHAQNWRALWWTGSSHPNREVQDAARYGGTEGYYHPPETSISLWVRTMGSLHAREW